MGGKCISRRQAGSLETLTFEQLKRVSEKSLVALFTETTANELSKQYWSHCRLLPDCTVSYNSFGGDAKAKSLVKQHLLEHISQLSQNPDSANMTFEPVAVRKRRESETRKYRKQKPKSPRAKVKLEEEDHGCEIIEDDIDMDITCHDHSYTVVSNSVRSIPDVQQTVEIYDTEAPQDGPEVTVDSMDSNPIQYLTVEQQDNTNVVHVVVEQEQTKREIYPPMPKYEVGRSRTIVEIDDEDIDNLDDVMEGSEEWIRRMALRCMRDLRNKKDTDFVCRICKPEKRFTASATLLYHYRSHAKIKPFICLICNSAFTRQHSLNYHMLIHNNQSRFTCQECGRKFRHPSHFREHKRRHTGETPFECEDCGSKFKTRNTFKRHLKTRHSKILTPHGVIGSTNEVENYEVEEGLAVLTTSNC